MTNPFDSHGDEFSHVFSSSVNESAELLKDNYEALLEMSNKINTPKDDAKFRQNMYKLKYSSLKLSLKLIF